MTDKLAEVQSLYSKEQLAGRELAAQLARQQKELDASSRAAAELQAERELVSWCHTV
jgi:hypothetical protein